MTNSPRICSVVGCDRKQHMRGLCSAHWQRWKRHGVTMPERPISKSINHLGAMNGRWKGGQMQDGHGRIYIYCPGHPYPSYNRTHVYRYRLVMENHLGRYLLPTEIVHHKNGIVNDDRLENLEVMSQSKHAFDHIMQRMNGKWSYKHDCCKCCGKTDRKHEGHGLCHACYRRKENKPCKHL